MRGLLIVLEGIDGTGKSSHAAHLKNWLESQGHLVIASREPTDGPWGKRLRESAVLGRMTAEEELDTFLKDRKQHVENLIEPSLAAGKIVILDRYYFSTMAYQGARGLNPSEIRQRNEQFAPRPDLLLILDLPVEQAHQRIGGRGDSTDEFEKREALQLCRDIFLSLRDEEFAVVIDSNQSWNQVSSDITRTVSQFLKARADVD